MISQSIGALAVALSKAQAEIQGAVKDSQNPFFKSNYADLSSVWEACRGPLTKNGLCVIQTTEMQEKGLMLVTLLAHSSGEYICGYYPINPSKPDPQALGSAITYARRYALAAIVGVCPVDDDGEGAMHRNAPPERVKIKPESVVGGESKRVTPPQLDRLFAIANKAKWTNEQVRQYLILTFKLNSSKELNLIQYEDLCKHLERNPQGVIDDTKRERRSENPNPPDAHGP